MSGNLKSFACLQMLHDSFTQSHMVVGVLKLYRYYNDVNFIYTHQSNCGLLITVLANHFQMILYKLIAYKDMLT